MTRAHAIEAELTWTGARFERDRRIEVDAGGRIARMISMAGPGSAGDAPDTALPTHAMPRRAVVPGFVNAHSHAFQRGLRGRGERFEAGRGSFWSWREAMYALVEQLDPDRVHELSRQAFEEMRRAGITAVGEFHYVHHDASGAGDALDDAVIAAARDAGIRLVLLQTCYRTGGIARPLEGGQRRFAAPSVDAYFDRVDRLAAALDGGVGVVAHSIRAVALDEIVALHAGACARGMVFHMHVEEQPREIAACVEHYGAPPMRLLLDRLDLDARFTAVHCTHTNADDMRAFLARGGNVCICPLTEANLGDGTADVPAIRGAGGAICVGTDSNARLCMLEELRWLELAQRLVTGTRGVIVDGDGHSARALLAIGTRAGARSLGLPAGAIEPGAWADLAAIDLDAASLRGSTDDTLLDALVFGAGNDAIAGTCVGGRWPA